MREPRLAGGRSVVDEVEEAIGEEHGLGVLGVVLRSPSSAVGRPVDERAPVVGHVARPSARIQSSQSAGSPSGR